MAAVLLFFCPWANSEANQLKLVGTNKIKRIIATFTENWWAMKKSEKWKKSN